MEFMKMMLGSVKNLLGKKSTQAILKYLASVALNYASNKYDIPQYKYDPMDMKNMVYHYNMNNNNQINKNEVDSMIDLFAIERFINELNMQNKNNNLNPDDFMYQLAKACNDGKVIETYNNMNNNNQILKLFDNDTLETSSIVDNYEISSGGIYLPDRNIITTTNEGEFIANAKNDYLEKRSVLGNGASKDEISRLIREYYDNIEQERVSKYYNL